MVKTINRLSLIVKALLNRGLDLDFQALDILSVLIVASYWYFYLLHGHYIDHVSDIEHDP